MIDNNLVA